MSNFEQKKLRAEQLRNELNHHIYRYYVENENDISDYEYDMLMRELDSIEKEYPERRTYTVDDIARMLNIGRTSAYLLVKEGHFKIVRIGNAIRISKKSFDAWLDSLEL